MDEIERIENKRWALFVFEAAVAFVLLFWLTRAIFASFVLSFGVGLFFSGLKVARELTQPYAWAHLEAEARITGRPPSRRGIWLGNTVPGIIVFIIGAWLVINA
jgi:hypothetical protein